MPKLNEIIKEREGRKFIKKSYRPWDLTGDGDTSINETYDDDSSNGTSQISSISKANTVVNITEVLPVINEIKPYLSIETDTKIDNEQETIEQQLGNKQKTIRKHIEDKEETNQETIRQQLDISLDPTTLYNQLIKLSGIQKNILNFIIDVCMLRNGLETGPIETSTIAMCVKTTAGSIKISLKRLIDKGFVIRNKGKQAKGGYINLSVKKDVLNTVIQQRESNSRILNPAELLSSIRYQMDNTTTYSSNSILKNNTTKKQDIFPDEWAEIDYESLSHIGFTKTQIKQLIEKNETSIVQESINHFAFGLEHNPKFQKYEDPLNVLMGVLRKGQGWYEKDYRSPQELAQIRLLENKKAEIERKKNFEEESYKLAFGEWREELSDVEVEQIAPKKGGADLAPQSSRLSIYFKKNIWPSKKTEYLISE